MNGKLLKINYGFDYENIYSYTDDVDDPHICVEVDARSPRHKRIYYGKITILTYNGLIIVSRDGCGEHELNFLRKLHHDGWLEITDDSFCLKIYEEVVTGKL